MYTNRRHLALLTARSGARAAPEAEGLTSSTPPRPPEGIQLQDRSDEAPPPAPIYLARGSILEPLAESFAAPASPCMHTILTLHTAPGLRRYLRAHYNK